MNKAQGFSRIKKLSTLIDVALEDLRKVERRKGFSISMIVWVREAYEMFGTKKTCYACVAGSVMICRLNAMEKLDYRNETEPSDYPLRVKNRLSAIDELRCGFVRDAGSTIGVPLNRIPDNLAYREITPYHEDRKIFFKDMRKLSKDLKAAGL